MNNLERSISVSRQLRKAKLKELLHKKLRLAEGYSAGPRTLQRIKHPGRVNVSL